MTNVLKTAYNEALSGQISEYRASVCNTSLVNADGSNNYEKISEVALCEARELLSGLENKTLAALITQMKIYMSETKWEELSALLCVHFYMIRNRPPTLFIRRMAHNEVFREYCEYLYKHLTQK